MFQRALFGPLIAAILGSKLFVDLGIKPPLQRKEIKRDVKNGKPVQELIWLNIISIAFIHLLALYGLYLVIIHKPIGLSIFAWFYGYLGGLGVTAGVHRLWAHKAYKATLPFKIFILYCFTASGQNTVYDWVRDHRIHHKYSETDADPHNAKRGFFFSHVGWLMMTKHPEVYEKGKTIDMSDIENDPLLAFQKKYFVYLKILAAFVIPACIPPLLWGESWKLSIIVMSSLRYVFLLNITFLVNSAAHIWGNHPFDKRMQAAQNRFVSAMALGEGWHNYHHVFPWDYKASELGPYSTNWTTMILDFAAKLGLVYDLKEPSKKLIEAVAKKHGDGSWHGLEYNQDGVLDESESKSL